MIRLFARAVAAVGLLLALSAPALAQDKPRLEVHTLATKLVPSPATYSILLPAGYDTATKPYPLVFLLHGGGGDNGFLKRMQPTIEAAWAAGDLPPAVIVTPDAHRSLYSDYKDGSEKWETFIVKELVPHLRATYKVSPDKSQTVVTGVSMGGLGSLRLGLKHPDIFGGLASLEAGIEPALDFDKVTPRNSFQRSDAFFKKIFGDPVDKAYWQAFNPANIAIRDREKILKSGLQIYLEVGDQDMFHLDEGNEWMHRVLWDHNIPHEYRLVHGANHVGKSVPGRLRDGFRFLNTHVLNPPPADNTLGEAIARTNAMKKAAGVDDTLPRPPLPPTN